MENQLNTTEELLDKEVRIQKAKERKAQRLLEKTLKLEIENHSIDNSIQPFSAVTNKKKSTIIKEGQKQRSKKESHYVDNGAFFIAMKGYIEACALNTSNGLKRPQIPNFIGECFLKIASKFVNHPSFSRYTYKDELIDRAVEACIRYLHNFDPKKSENPFSYFTQTCYYSVMNSLEIEEKETYVKYKSILDAISCNMGADFDSEEDAAAMFVMNVEMDLTHIEEYVHRFEAKMQRKRDKDKAGAITKESKLDVFFDSDA